jgi:hypothetical protein
LKGGEIMHDINAIKAEMVRNGYNNTTMAAALDITPKTFGARLKTEDFTSSEISTMINLLNLKEPWNIFFITKVT